MCNLLTERVLPVVVGFLGLASIDTPHNYVRRVLLDVVGIIVEHFGAALQALS
jgi:hypothetical protein